MVELDGAIRVLDHGGSAVLQGITIFPFTERKDVSQLFNHLVVDLGGWIAATQHVIHVETDHPHQTTVQNHR